MSTCNFGLPHMAKTIHAFGMRNDDEYNDDEYMESFALDNVKEALKYYGVNINEGRESIGYKLGWLDGENFCLNKIEIFVEPVFFYSSGYYEGAMLDFYLRISIDDNCGLYEEYESTDYSDVSDLFEQIADDFIEYSDLWNTGMRKIQRKNLIRLLEKSCDKIMDEADKICSDCTEMNLIRTAVFSNGEAVYEIV